MSAKIKTTAWDSSEYLRDADDIRLYIEAAQEEAPDDAAFLATVLGTVARARNMTELARKTGIARETLYKVTRGEGNPTLDTVGKLAKELGFRLTLAPMDERDASIKTPKVSTGQYVTRSVGKSSHSTKVGSDPMPKKPAAPAGRYVSQHVGKGGHGAKVVSDSKSGKPAAPLARVARKRA